jgi:glycosyltransferase involved in cell wall biosynthesis
MEPPSPLPNPAVSVVVPAYRVSGFIAETLDSILAQTFREYEIIVVNDGSPDTPDLERVLEPYLQRIVYIRQANGGPSAARNAGIRRSAADYVAFLDGDDLWEPDYLETQMHILQADPDLDLLYCDTRYFGDSRLAGRTFMQCFPSEGPVTAESLLRETCMAPLSTVTVRRAALLHAGLFNDRLGHSEDVDLWLRLALCGCRLQYHRGVLGRRRIRSGGQGGDREIMYAALARILESYSADPRLPPEGPSIISAKLQELNSVVCLEKGKRLLKLGSYAEALALLEASNRYSTSAKLRCAIWSLRLAPGLTRLAFHLLDWLRR